MRRRHVNRDTRSAASPHLQPGSFLPAHLVQELHLQDDSRVHPGREGEAGDDDPSTEGVGKVQTLAGLEQGDVCRDVLK